MKKYEHKTITISQTRPGTDLMHEVLIALDHEGAQGWRTVAALGLKEEVAAFLLEREVEEPWDPKMQVPGII